MTPIYDDHASCAMPEDADHGPWWDQPEHLAHPENVVPPMGSKANAQRFLFVGDIADDLEDTSFVQGLLDRQTIFMIYGPSNVGKTFWAADLLMHVAMGWKWRDRRVRQGAVIYISMEGVRGQRRRLRAWLKHHKVSGKSCPFVLLQSRVSLLSRDVDDVSQLLREIDHLRRTEPRLEGVGLAAVVFDTLAMATAGGNENSGEDMGAVMGNLERIKADTGAAVGVIHHTGKAVENGARGWSGIRAAVDTEIEIRWKKGQRKAVDGVEEDEVEEVSKAPKIREAAVRKQRDMEGNDVFPFTLSTVEIGRDPEFGALIKSAVVELPPENALIENSDRSIAKDDQSILCLRRLQAALAEPAWAVYGRVPGQRPTEAAVAEERWRAECYATCLSGLASEARKKAFQRARDRLEKWGKVSARDGYVWLAHPEPSNGG